MSTKHTPGPWAVVKVAETLTIKSLVQPGYFAEIRGACAGAHEQGEGNARLIAAAPDLLEACKRMVDFEQRLLCSNDGGPALAADIRAAIKKAEGK